MVEKVHAGEVVKFIGSFKDKSCTLKDLKAKFDNCEFNNCSGDVLSFDELIEFMIKKDAILIDGDKVVFKGCPSSGC